MGNLFSLAVIGTKILIRGGFRAARAALALQQGHFWGIDWQADSEPSSDISVSRHIRAVKKEKEKEGAEIAVSTV